MHSRDNKSKKIIKSETQDTPSLVQDKLNYLSKMVPLGSMAYIATALTIVYFVRDRVDSLPLFLWAGTVSAVVLLRSLVAVLFNRKKTITHFYFLFFIMMFLTAMVWGFSGFILLTDNNSSNMLILVCMLGIATGGVSTLASDFRQITVFLSVLLFPYIIRLCLFHTEYYYISAGLILVYYFLVLGIGYKINRTITENNNYAWENKKAMEDLAASERKFRTIFKHAPAGIFYYNTDFVIYDCNEEFCSILETSRDSMINYNMNNIKDKRVFKSIHDAVLGKTGYYEGDYHTTLSNNQIWISMTCSPVYDMAGALTGAVGILQDRTEYQLIEEKVRHLAYHDSLTGLPNRMLLKDRIEQALSQSRRIGCKGALLFLDLDNFKNINDTLGHHVGDKILKKTAEKLKAVVRAEDTVSRIGGDEFVILLPRLQEETDEAVFSASLVADKIHKKLAKPFNMVEKTLFTSTSIGITLFSNEEESSDDLLKNADTAMYEAKKNGRSCTYFFNKKMNTSIEKRMKLENSLLTAIENREFVLNFQPIYDTEENRYTGAETLIRWNHPELGTVPPGDFIPLAEETGLIMNLGKWIIEEVCKKIESWDKKYSNPLKYVSINISAKQLKQDDFSGFVLGTIEKYSIPPDMIVLEITENVLIDNFEKTMKTISELRKQNISFALDDFGTGYSSLTYLKNLALDIIKIDRSFIQDIISDENDSALVKAILTIARNFNTDVIAEGVETSDQAGKLTALGCRSHQGFFYSKPVAAEELELFFN